MLTDTHTHLTLPTYNADREEVIARAQAEGVRRLVVIGLDLASSRAAVALAECQENLWATVGVHPHEAAALDEETLEALTELAAHPKVVAWGEIGLDYYRHRTPRKVQREAFRRQLARARAVGRPVVVHDREAHEEVFALLEEAEAWARGGVMHCFSGDRALAERYLARGFYIGLDGPVTFPKASRLHDLAAHLPLNALLLETDCPYLTPHPYRGRRNEPAYLRYIAERVAQLRGLTVEAVAEVTSANAVRLFGWSSLA
ncbi:MAG TPA: TatD family deoxyribonuclease [Armatimonadetes bacterium]|nr:TatD family deoxyribonuclease [Armatimonadota bacterium]